MNYKVKPIPNEIVRKVRGESISPQYRGLAAVTSLATGYGPCRSCLRTFVEKEENRIYFTYNSFEGLSPLPAPGPVFIHENECDAYAAGEFPASLAAIPMLLEAFSDESVLVSRTPANVERIDDQIAEIFEDSAVRFINLRNAEAGCFIARIDRS